MSPLSSTPYNLSVNLSEVSSILSGAESPESSFDRSSLPASYFTFSIVDHPDRLVVHWPEEFGPDFLQAVTKITKAFRVEKRDPSFVDFIVSNLFIKKLSSR
jgi:hypothetical protein